MASWDAEGLIISAFICTKQSHITEHCSKTDLSQSGICLRHLEGA